MNEELLFKIYNTYGLSAKGDFDQFKHDMEDPKVQESVFNKFLADKGNFQQFQTDLKIPVQNTPGQTYQPIPEHEDPLRANKPKNAVTPYDIADIEKTVANNYQSELDKRNNDLKEQVGASSNPTQVMHNFGTQASFEKKRLPELRLQELKNRGIDPNELTPDELYDILYPGEAKKRLDNATLLDDQLAKKINKDGTFNTEVVNDSFLREIGGGTIDVDRISGLGLPFGNELAKLFANDYTPKQILEAKPGDLEDFPDTPRGKERLLRLQQYVFAGDMEKAKLERDKIYAYQTYTQAHADATIPPQVKQANTDIKIAQRKLDAGILTQEDYDKAESARKYLATLPEDVKKNIDEVGQLQSESFKRLKEIDKTYPSLKAVDVLNEDLQKAHDAEFANHSWYARAGLNIGAAFQEAIPRLNQGLSNTFDVAGTLLGSKGAQANMVRDALDYVQKGTWRDSSAEQRPIYERVYKFKDAKSGKEYQVGLDDQGAVTNIYDNFGNAADLEPKLAKKIISKVQFNPEAFAQSKKQVNGSAAFNAITDASSDLIGTLALATISGGIIPGTGYIAEAATNFVPIFFQYSGNLAAQGINQGLTPEQAAVYGLASGFGEGLSESIFPWAGKLGKSFNTIKNVSVKQALERIGVDGVDKMLAKMGKKEFYAMLLKIPVQEGFEEVVMDYFQPALNAAQNNLMNTDLNTELPNFENIAQDFGIGAAVSIIPGIAGAGGQSKLLRSDGFMTQSIYSVLRDPVRAERMARAMAEKTGDNNYNLIADKIDGVSKHLKDDIDLTGLNDKERLETVRQAWNDYTLQENPNAGLVADDGESWIHGIIDPILANPVEAIPNKSEEPTIVPETPKAEETKKEYIPQTRQELLGDVVDYGGIKGTLVQGTEWNDGRLVEDPNGDYYVIGEDGQATMIHSGLSDATNEDIGLSRYRHGGEEETNPNAPKGNVTTDFANNKVVYNDKNYEFVAENEAGNVVLKNEQGKEIVVRNPDTIAKILEDKILFETNFDGTTDEQLTEAISEALPVTKKRGRPATRPQPTEQVQSTEGTKENKGTGSAKSRIDAQRSQARSIDDELVTLSDLVFDVVKANQVKFANSINKFLDGIFTIGALTNKKAIAKAFGDLVEETRFNDELKGLIGEDTIASIKALNKDRRELASLLTPTNVKTQVLAENLEIAKKLEAERKAKEEAARERSGVSKKAEAKIPVAEAKAKETQPEAKKQLVGNKPINKAKPQNTDTLGQIKSETVTGTILDKGNDLLGDEKKAWMKTQQQFIDEESGQQKKQRHEKAVKSALENNAYTKAIEKGRMTAKDAETIIKSANLKVPENIEEKVVEQEIALEQIKQVPADVATAIEEAIPVVTETIEEQKTNIAPVIKEEDLTPEQVPTKSKRSDKYTINPKTGNIESVEIIREGTGETSQVRFSDGTVEFPLKSALYSNKEDAIEANKKLPKRKNAKSISHVVLLETEFPGQEIKSLNKTEKKSELIITIRNSDGEVVKETKPNIHVGDITTSKKGTKFVVTGFSGTNVIIADNANGYVTESSYDLNSDIVKNIIQSNEVAPAVEEIAPEKPVVETIPEPQVLDTDSVAEVKQEEEGLPKSDLRKVQPLETGTKPVLRDTAKGIKGDVVSYQGKDYYVKSITKQGDMMLIGVNTTEVLGGVNISELDGKVDYTIAPILSSVPIALGSNGNLLEQGKSALGQILRYDYGISTEQKSVLSKLLKTFEDTRADKDWNRFAKAFLTIINERDRYVKDDASEFNEKDIIFETTLKDALKDVKPNLGIGQSIIIGLLKNLNTRVVVLPGNYFLKSSAYYVTEKNTILLKEDFLTSDLIHEGVHSLTMSLYNTNNEFKEEFDKLFNDLKEGVSKGKWKSVNELFTDEYGFSSPVEFLTELFSNSSFNEKIGRLPASIYNKAYTGISILDNIINMIVQYFSTGKFGKLDVSTYWANRIKYNQADFFNAIKTSFGQNAIGNNILASKNSTPISIAPDTLPNVYKHQDANAERLIDKSFTINGKKYEWKNNVWRYKFENAGDILRELAKYKNEFLDPGYIYEKVDKINDFIKDQKGIEGQLRQHPDDTYFQLQRKDKELLDLLRQAYIEQPVLSEAQAKAKELVLNLVDGKLEEVQKQVDYFLSFRKGDSRAKLMKANTYKPEVYLEKKAPDVLYHGTNADIRAKDIKNQGYGIYTTPEFKVARSYAGTDDPMQEDYDPSNPVGATVVLKFKPKTNAKFLEMLDINTIESFIKTNKLSNKYLGYSIDEVDGITYIDHDLREEISNIAKKTGYDFIVINDNTSGHHLSYIALDEGSLVPAEESEIYGSLSSFFRDMFNRKVNDIELTPEEESVVKPVPEKSNKEYNKEQVLKGLQLAILNGSLNLSPEEIFKKAKNYFETKGISIDDIRNLSISSTVISPNIEETNNEAEIPNELLKTLEKTIDNLPLVERDKKFGPNVVFDPQFGQQWSLGKYTYADIFNKALEARRTKNVGSINLLYDYLIALNPELANIKFTDISGKEDIVMGVGSGIHYNDIKYFVEDIRGSAVNQTKEDKALSERAKHVYDLLPNKGRLDFVLSPETAKRVLNNNPYNPEATPEILKPKKEKKVVDNTTRLPVTGGEGIKMDNAMIKDIRDNLFRVTGLANIFKSKEKRTLRKIIEDTVKGDYISRDGSFTRETQIAQDILIENKPGRDTEIIALYYAILQLARIKSRQDLELEQAVKDNDSIRETKAIQDLEETRRLVDMYTRASKEAGTQSSYGLLVRKYVLREEDFSEEGIIKRLSEETKKRKLGSVKLTEENQKEIRKYAGVIHKLQQKLEKTKAELKLKGKNAAINIAEGVVDDIKSKKDIKREENNKIRITKNLSEAIQQMNDVLSGKICD